MLRKTCSAIVLLALGAAAAHAQFKLKVNDKAVSAAGKGVKAASFSDEDAARLARQSVEWMDAHNPVADENDPYTVRLTKLVDGYKSEDGLQLNFKVYKVVDINAFACADGSVRVFSSLMDMMTDDELLSVIGHEIGHIKNHDTRDAIRQAYMRSAAADAASSQSGAAATLSDSELGSLANALLDSKYDRKQESAADAYGYEFLKKHGHNVMAMVSAFRKLAALSAGQQQSKMQKMLNTHPDSEARALAISERAKKDGLDK